MTPSLRQVGVDPSPQQLRQLGDVGGEAPPLITREQCERRAPPWPLEERPEVLRVYIQLDGRILKGAGEAGFQKKEAFKDSLTSVGDCGECVSDGGQCISEHTRCGGPVARH